VLEIMAALGHKTPKMALYYCRLANQKLLADQAADILDIAFGERQAAKIGSAGLTSRLCPEHHRTCPPAIGLGAG
jgi:hypothetical protein